MRNHQKIYMASIIFALGLLPGCKARQSSNNLKAVTTDRQSDGSANFERYLYRIENRNVIKGLCNHPPSLRDSQFTCKKDVASVPLTHFVDYYIHDQSLAKEMADTLDAVSKNRMGAAGMAVSQKLFPEAINSPAGAEIVASGLRDSQAKLDDLKETYGGLISLLDKMAQSRDYYNYDGRHPVPDDETYFVNNMNQAFLFASDMPGAKCKSETGGFKTEGGGCKDTAAGLVWGETARVGFTRLSGVDAWSNKLAAMQYCANATIGGFKDWRLPTIAELKVGGSKGRIAIDFNMNHVYLGRDAEDIQTEQALTKQLEDRIESTTTVGNISMTIGGHTVGYTVYQVNKMRETNRMYNGRIKFAVHIDSALEVATGRVVKRAVTTILFSDARYSSEVTNRNFSVFFGGVYGDDVFVEPGQTTRHSVNYAVNFFDVFPDPRADDYNQFPGVKNDSVAMICVRGQK